MSEWIYEPCENEGGYDDKGRLYPHAVRGLKPAGRRVMGYGMQEEDAYTDAREKARQHDEGEVLGERGEVRRSGAERVNIEFTIRKIVVHPDFILYDTYPGIIIARDMDVPKDEVRLISESGTRMMVLKVKDAASCLP